MVSRKKKISKRMTARRKAKAAADENEMTFAALEAVEMFVRMVQQSGDDKDAKAELLGEWRRNLAQMRSGAEQAIKQWQSRRQTKRAKEQIALWRRLLAQIGPTDDAPMSVQ